MGWENIWGRKGFGGKKRFGVGKDLGDPEGKDLGDERISGE